MIASLVLVGAHASLFSISSDGTTSSATFDAETSRLYLTGSIGDDCFLGILQLSGWDTAKEPYWIRQLSLGVPNQREVCSSILTCRTGNVRRLMLAGVSYGSGESMLQTDSVSDHTGWLWDVSFYGQVHGGLSIPNQIPLSLTNTPLCEADVYMTWASASANAPQSRVLRVGQPSLEKEDLFTTLASSSEYTTEQAEAYGLFQNKTVENPDADEYGDYAYMQAPWTTQWETSVASSSTEARVYAIKDKLVLLTPSSVHLLDKDSGRIRRSQELDARVIGLCFVPDADFLFVLGTDILQNDASLIWQLDLRKLTIESEIPVFRPIQ